MENSARVHSEAGSTSGRATYQPETEATHIISPF